MVTSRFAATAEVAPGGVALLVGIGGRLIVVCAAAAIDVGLRHVVVPRVDDACSSMAEIEPRVVVLPASMDRADRARVAAAALAVDAELVDLNVVVAPADVAHAVARALAIHESRRATSEEGGPSTQRAPDHVPSSDRKRDDER